MKKFFTLVSACLMAFAANAQDKIYLNASDESVVEIDLNNVEEISFSRLGITKIVDIHDIIGGEKSQKDNKVYLRLTGDVAVAVDYETFEQILFEKDEEVSAVKLSDFSELLAHEQVELDMVDLGLSVKWGTINMGAKYLTDKGSVYKLGQVDPNADYPTIPYGYDSISADEELYSYFLDIHGNPGRNYDSYYGLTETKYDAAHVNLGDDWRLPTHTEWNELRDNCTWEKVTLDGINIMKITSNIEGYTDKFIYLPLVDPDEEKPSRCTYWTANPWYVGGINYGIGICIPSSTDVVFSPATRQLPLRPVYGKSGRTNKDNSENED
ncbi:MAG: hypothetical protein MJZ31_09315 [Bacteroidales bacterium]|nr:hypothetical protein [Bacteroidales bacterium]